MRKLEDVMDKYILIKEQAKLLLATTIVVWLMRFKYWLCTPYRLLKEKIQEAIAKFITRYQTRKDARENKLYGWMKLAAEDCVVLYPEMRLARYVLKFEATKDNQIDPDLQKALSLYFKTHKDPSKYGDIMQAALKKDPNAAAGLTFLSKGEATDKRTTHKARYWKTVRNIEEQRHRNRRGMSSFEAKKADLQRKIAQLGSNLEKWKKQLDELEEQGKDMSDQRIKLSGNYIRLNRMIKELAQLEGRDA